MKTEIQQLINFLLNEGISPLPVAPFQDPYKFHKVVKKTKTKGDHCPLTDDLKPQPLFTGKNPSYLDGKNKPHLVKHAEFQNKIPGWATLRKWFANPDNGIGALGDKNIYWLDLDRKHFDSDAACEKALNEIFNRQPELMNGLVERTHSGGYRVGFRLTEPPTFTNFALEPGGDHVGELLGAGRFAVLSPTIGPSGNAYKNLGMPEKLPTIPSANFIFPVGQLPKAEIKPSSPKASPIPVSEPTPGAISLVDCLSKTAQDIYRGNDVKGDESYSLTVFIKEAIGWANWLDLNQVAYYENPTALIFIAGEGLGHDVPKVERIIKSIKNQDQLVPALYLAKGDDGCWGKVRKLQGVKSPPEAKTVAVKTSTPLKEVSQYDDQEDDDSAPGQPGKGKSYDDPALSWKEKAYLDCFSEGEYISFGDDKKLALYKFNGQYYEKFPRSEAEALLIEWAYQNPVKVKGGKWVCSHLSPDHINQAYEWSLKRKRVSDDLINPPGINLANGRLTIQWDGKTPKYVITPHTPDIYYTYCSPIKYDPLANPEYCDKLLSCISPQEQTIFLRSVALAFDLENFRRYTGRPRALFLEGVGENGKDSLRLVVEQIFGQFMVDTALNNFYQFEQGQIGGLADLDGSLVSWASENSDQYKVEKLKSLFRLISGEQVKINPKGRDERTIKPNVVFFFNVNEAPRMDGSLNAMKSRFCVIRFAKSFKMHPNPNDSSEMQADPRFKYDPLWVQENVSPAFLNRVLAEIPAIATDGIPYGNLDHYFQEIRKKSNHLWEFVEEMGMVEDQNGKIYISDLWAILREWYEANGTLEVIQPENEKGRPKLIWHEQLKRFDRPIKGANQIFDAFSQLFPKITKQRETAKNSRTGAFYLSGLKLPETASTASTAYSMGVTASTLSSTSFNSSSTNEEEEKEETKQSARVEAVVEAKVEAVKTSEVSQGARLKQLKQFERGHTPPVAKTNTTMSEHPDREVAIALINLEIQRLGWRRDLVKYFAFNLVGKESFDDLSEAEAIRLLEAFKRQEVL